LLRIGEAPFSWTLVLSGVVLTIGGEVVRLLAVRQIGAISRTRSERLGPLVASGPFGLVRNPLYIGNILIWCGFAMTARLVWAAPVIAILLLAEYHAIVGWEEQLLEARHGRSYREYAANVPRWMPKLRMMSDSNGREDVDTATFSWRETLFSERGTLIAIAVGYLLLWTKARF
jgi:protein-S-isoprenylcysteine O-methyltransferase Ste14